MSHYLKYAAFALLGLGEVPGQAQSFPAAQDPLPWEKKSETEKRRESLLWLRKQALRDEITFVTEDLLRQSTTYGEVLRLLRISRFDSRILRTIPSLVPVKQSSVRNFRVSSGFGYRAHPVKDAVLFHGGIDIPAPNGTPVYAVADAVVSRSVSFHEALGNFVQLDHRNGFSTVYGHLLRFIVTPGQTVQQGQVVGYVGQTGLSTGNHLHYIVAKNGRPLDPLPFCFLMFEKFRAEAGTPYSSRSK
ncbi:M23 family metallopeptidase [Rufibacter latericius]|uniref:M23 family metallopeptidase n=1 Tax=Rufibacter latericius TaxID=2487040 RepID=A0A3M9MEW1_9BACT|nr:M23 family metallopeptidase [Rufibacter latericius]RNI24101.1 M23 family metallopeptidase [Rufibacter latericius]